jgi:hypothetical protein
MDTIEIEQGEDRNRKIIEAVRGLIGDSRFRGLAYFSNPENPYAASRRFSEMLQESFQAASFNTHTGRMKWPNGAMLDIGYGAYLNFRSGEYTCLLVDDKTIGTSDKAFLLSRLRAPLPPALTLISLT